MKRIDACCIVGGGRDSIDIMALLDSMDRNCVDQSVLFPEDSFAAVYNAEGNDFIARAVLEHPDRLLGFAAANPWYGKRAVKELEVRLREGFCGVYFKSTVQGFSIDDEIVYPLVELCEQYGAPAYFHTGTPVMALPFQLMLLSRRFPGVNFIMGHMGCFDFVGDAYASARQQKNIYLETSLALTFFMRTLSLEFPRQALFGSCSPRSSQEIELKKLLAAVEDEEVRNDILGGNLERILGATHDY